MTWRSPATGRSCSSRTGPAGWFASLDPADLKTVARIASRRTPEPDRRPSPGRPDLRRLCVERLRLGHRHPPRDRHRDDPHGPVPQGAGGEHSRRPGGRPGRQDAVCGQRRQQLRRGDRHRRGRPQPGQGIHPDRLVSDGGGGDAGREDPADRRRQGQPDQGQPDRSGQGRQAKPADGPPTGHAPAVSLHRHDALRRPVDRPDPRREGAGRGSPRRSTATARIPTSCSPMPRIPSRPRSPRKVGDPSPIKHVLYIIKENRTYDQVFGDICRGATAIRRW